MHARLPGFVDAPSIADRALELRLAVRTVEDFQNHVERSFTSPTARRGAPAFAQAMPLPEWPVAVDASGVVGECLERARKWIDAWNDSRQGPDVLLAHAPETTAIRLRRDWVELSRGVLADLADAAARWERIESMNRPPALPARGVLRRAARRA